MAYNAASFDWPEAFVRVPREEWAHGRELDEDGRRYHSFGFHMWYRNLDFTLGELLNFVRDGHLIVDYSGGTGI